MPRIVAVANQKGGVGKTSTVLNLGAALAERGHRVLLLDLDPQAALTASVGLDPYKVSPSINEILLDEATEWREVVHPLGSGMWLVPSSVELAAAEFRMAFLSDRALRLKRALQRGKPIVDVVLIDTPPSLGLLTVNALAAAGAMLIPVECQYLALRGVRAVLETTRLIHERLHPDLILLGLIATLYHADSDHSRSVLSELRRVFGGRVFDAVIRFDEAAAMAPAARQSVLAFRPDSQAAADYRRLADEVLYRWKQGTEGSEL
jgi:chromosome partitioning protein